MSNVNQKIPRRRPPARTPEARENQLISLAIELVEKKLLNGTATSQEVCHFLKLASSKERKELELLSQELELKKAKTKAIQSSENIEKLYKDAMRAFSTYSGNGGDDNNDD